MLTYNIEYDVCILPLISPRLHSSDTGYVWYSQYLISLMMSRNPTIINKES